LNLLHHFCARTAARIARTTSNALN
jgi:hypothetical protein